MLASSPRDVESCQAPTALLAAHLQLRDAMISAETLLREALAEKCRGWGSGWVWMGLDGSGWVWMGLDNSVHIGHWPHDQHRRAIGRMQVAAAWPEKCEQKFRWTMKPGGLAQKSPELQSFLA